jgi:hypothetical protein
VGRRSSGETNGGHLAESIADQLQHRGGDPGTTVEDDRSTTAINFPPRWSSAWKSVSNFGELLCRLIREHADEAPIAMTPNGFDLDLPACPPKPHGHGMKMVAIAIEEALCTTNTSSP